MERIRRSLLALVLGAKNVHAPAPNDDKSSCSGNLDPSRRDPAHLAAALPGPSGTRPMDRPGPARRWPLVERHRQRSRQTLLAGLIGQADRRRRNIPLLIQKQTSAATR